MYRIRILVVLIFALLIITACSTGIKDLTKNLASSASKNQNQESVADSELDDPIVGTWKLVGFADVVKNGVSVPDDANVEFNQTVFSRMNAQYQFTADGTVEWRMTATDDGQTLSQSALGTYALSQDRTTLNLKISKNWLSDIMAFGGAEEKLQIRPFIEGNKLTLRYYFIADTYTDVAFERVE